MKVLYDYRGLAIRLTQERLAHILEHPEMEGMAPAIEETLRQPKSVIQSQSDDEARLYYRFYEGTRVGSKHLCVIVKVSPSDAFVLTAYLTNKIKQGEQLWPTRK